MATDPIVIGTDHTCDLRLHDPAVSNRHASLRPTADGVLLMDLGSTNGTYVAGCRINSIYLPPETRVTLGESVISYRLEHGSVEVPLSSKARFGSLLGHGDAMRATFGILERMAKCDATVLLEGESGTGKELAAQALHDYSERKGGPFIAVDCGAIPAELIESELFGHVRGSFTGATTDRTGLFEQAGQGTLFLDEIGELPLDLQPRLLRALESREIRRVGESRVRPIDVRIVAATNRKLECEVEQNRFRPDLFYRLSVVRVRLPPLRERREEIPRLISHFLAEFGRDPAEPLPASIVAAFESHSWPGNVRELRNVIQRIALLPGMASEFYLESRSAGPGSASAATQFGAILDLPFHEGKRIWLESFEREYLSSGLARCKGNISELARVTGLSRQSCHRLLKHHGLTE
jgi:DNA-binding NtrC family response regulator